MLNSIIQKFESNGLGLLRDGTVRLSPHNPHWQRIFSQEAHRIFEALKIPELKLYHVGSTSIPQIHAKPIIDILLTIPSHDLLDSKKTIFEKIGYEYKGEYGIEGRRYCVLYSLGKDKGYVHLQAFEEGSEEIEKHLVFRDYLRKHPHEASRYNDLEIDLVERKKVSRSNSLDLKGPLIEELTKEGVAWKKDHKSKTLVILGSADGGCQTEKWILSHSEFSDSDFFKLNQLVVHPYQYEKDYPANDQFLNLVEKMLNAETIILGSPVYWYTLSTHTKIFLDRFSDLISTHKELGQRLYGKRVSLMATGSDREPPVGFDVPINLTSIYFGMDYLGMKYKCTGE